MTTAELKQAKKAIDATKHEEFVDWRFEEWLNDPLQAAVLHQCKTQCGEFYESLKAAFHAGAKR